MDITDILGRVQPTNIPSVKQSGSPEQLREVAQEFESLFVKMLLDSMLASRNQENTLGYGGLAEDIFEDMLYTEYSRLIAKQGKFGIADMIVHQLSSKGQS